MATEKYKMKTETVHDNYRVVVQPVEPDTHFPTTHEYRVRQLQAISTGINRHVDDITGAIGVWDTKTVCVYCREPEEWAVDEDGIPACCKRAVEEWEALTGQKP